MNVTPANFDRLTDLLISQVKELAMIFCDRDGRILAWNRGAEEIFGVPAHEAVGGSIARLFTSEDNERGVPAHEIATALSDSPAEDDRWLVRGDGSRFWATGVAVAVRDEHGEIVGIGKVLRDRTDLREQMDMLRNRADAAKASSSRKDLFLATLSHELRNPLNALTTAEQLIRTTTTVTAELEYPLRVIGRQVAHLRRLVDDLLDLSRIGTGKIGLNMERTVLQDVILHSVERVESLMRAKGHELSVLLPPGPLLVHADPPRLEQVFVNLLDNAAKYTPESGHIWIKCTTEGEEATVHVEDDGIGINEEFLPQIFELFTQADESRGYSRGGLGLGLALVKSLAALHGGSVQVRSEGRGKGSKFTVRLPLP
jgi:two-component system CheB/CheR fusion protein